MFYIKYDKATPEEAAYVQAEREEEYRKRYEQRYRERMFGPLPPELKKYEGKVYRPEIRQISSYDEI
ncbi:MAG: hypothetical protein E6590_12840 [Clostridiales bacterium]|uniref:hypothetical protein n=1 Tax=Clostridium sp. TaxID=1506 RepID=UPI00290AE70E|nr:hypothetical protein [Clostridium sp.]MDU6274037.1 hypothetical protein [Clostridium sp.]MDU6360838.1 hypothetical protein [Clostridiales bacterium]